MACVYGVCALCWGCVRVCCGLRGWCVICMWLVYALCVCRVWGVLFVSAPWRTLKAIIQATDFWRTHRRLQDRTCDGCSMSRMANLRRSPFEHSGPHQCCPSASFYGCQSLSQPVSVPVCMYVCLYACLYVWQYLCQYACLFVC